jgi:hypothetical protein
LFSHFACVCIIVLFEFAAIKISLRAWLSLLISSLLRSWSDPVTSCSSARSSLQFPFCCLSWIFSLCCSPGRSDFSVCKPPLRFRWVSGVPLSGCVLCSVIPCELAPSTISFFTHAPSGLRTLFATGSQPCSAVSKESVRRCFNSWARAESARFQGPSKSSGAADRVSPFMSPGVWSLCRACFGSAGR